MIMRPRIHVGPDGERPLGKYITFDLEMDKHAVPAIRAYIKSCRKECPELADMLRDLLDDIKLDKSLKKMRLK